MFFWVLELAGSFWGHAILVVILVEFNFNTSCSILVVYSYRSLDPDAHVDP